MTTVLELIGEESRGERGRLLLVASLTGIANVALLVHVTAAAEGLNGVDWIAFALFIMTLGVYVLGARYTFRHSTDLIERALFKIKNRIIGEIERAELEAMEYIGAAEIKDTLTENISIVSDAAGPLANLIQSLCIAVAGMLYLVSLSVPAFALIVGLQGTGAWMYVLNTVKAKEALRSAAKERITYFEMLMDLLAGFKEVKFSRRRGRDLRQDLTASADALRRSKIEAGRVFNDNLVFAFALLFVVLGAVVFVLPQYQSLDVKTLGKLVPAVMFVWGPVGNLANLLPMYTRCNVALSRIDLLEGKIVAAVRASEVSSGAEDPWHDNIATIEARSVEYAYPARKNSDSFHIGPINLTIQAGEVLFIIGGNGSGKSTLLKVLTGLYRPTSGTLLCDGAEITAHNLAAYRERISSIFSDFHLFAKLYGLLEANSDEVKSLLARMQIQDKTSFKGGRFTKRDLSTGQKKRLAMIVSLLEDRSICVFDEWAADQDPEFRRYFYYELIPEFRERGKTVIVVSHDDRYFHCADRVVTIEYGKVLSIERPRAATGESPAGA